MELNISAEKIVVFRPAFLPFFNDNHIAVMLFTQLEFWWRTNGLKPFYKFVEPCAHELYRPGDSWFEELGLYTKPRFYRSSELVVKRWDSKAEFDAAEDKFDGLPYASFQIKLHHLTYYVRNDEYANTLIRNAYGIKPSMVNMYAAEYHNVTPPSNETLLRTYSTEITTENISIADSTESASKKLSIKNEKNKGLYAKAEKLNIPFTKIWEAYQRKGSKPRGATRWLQLTDAQRQAALDGIPAYFKYQPTFNYRKDLEGYLNNETWESNLTVPTGQGTAVDPYAELRTRRPAQQQN